MDSLNCSVVLHKVTAHSGNPYNDQDQADRLAREGSTKHKARVVCIYVVLRRPLDNQPKVVAALHHHYFYSV
jgi:hypothetical protein